MPIIMMKKKLPEKTNVLLSSYFYSREVVQMPRRWFQPDHGCSLRRNHRPNLSLNSIRNTLELNMIDI